MPEIVQAQCGYCHKRFGLRSDQLNRQVRCPHCKTIVKIAGQQDTAAGAIAALRQAEAEQHAAGGHHSATGHHSAPAIQGGIRSQSVAIVWVVLLGLALIGVIIGIWVVFSRRGQDGEGVASRGPQPGFGNAASSKAGPVGVDAAGNPLPAPAPAEGPKAKTPAVPPQEPIDVKVDRLLRGYKDETVTFAVGRVTNNTDDMIQVLKVVVDMMDKDEKVLGEAKAIILNIPPKYTVPLVADWQHDRGVRVRRWMVSMYETNPAGIPRELPPLVASDPWPKRDPNAIEPTGLIHVKVRNDGAVPVKDLTYAAILLNNENKIVGAAKGAVSQEIKPEGTADVSFRWTHCAGTLVNSALVWVQPEL